MCFCFLNQAGIPSNQIIIALEPEAASIYCKHLPVEKLKGGDAIDVFQPGSKYLVLDAGGLYLVFTFVVIKTIDLKYRLYYAY